MFIAAPGTSTSIADAAPLAPFWHQVGGFLRDLYSLEFAIYRASTEAEQNTPVQVFPVSGRETVDTANPGGVDRLGYGRYAARFTVDAAWTPGRYVLRWFWRSTAGDVEHTSDMPFDVMSVPSPVPFGALYALPSDMRAEGVVPALATDVRLVQCLSLASRQFEIFTRRLFAPRYLSLTLDGNGSVAVLLDLPIVALDELLFASITLFLSELPIDATAYRVYNRHLSGLTSPDDRQNPRLELYGIEDYVATFALQGARFPRGKQNVQVKGVFGYTDPDGTPFGSTPMLVQQAVKLLAYRSLRKFTNAQRAALLTAPFVSEEHTREQGVSFSRPTGLSSATGAYTGDPEIDTIVTMYRKPPMLGAALCRVTGAVV